ncbi:Glucosamine-6-phosphate deaminase 1 [Neomoorella glycerini]|uniref:Glucosamine-6-phosphate deaminase 1 n=1 Tax=Neomoorella glycerini TaxID=55779 RepID=A0A6I5ZR12_9FIRM|nr:glucosamine-6-phosphate deaminase [Moorella glycerini]QGP92045.1 Glucosamine-6-phosphate deaminase 1 [Moorella glycerini]
MEEKLEPVKEWLVDRLKVRVYSNRLEMGAAAAREVADKIKLILSEKETVNMVFAAAPSQAEFLEALSSIPGIDWSRVVAMHMDEYIGLPPGAPQRFGLWLKKYLFDRVRPGRVYYLDAGEGVEEKCKRYSELLQQYPVDITCLGIGENGHIAFNDPPVADFNDPLAVKVVELDERCRQQQVNDGCFATIDEVPARAITLTIPALLASRWIVGIVPGERKREAVYHALNGPIAPSCPASILRQHGGATLYLDAQAASLVFSLQQNL